MRSNKQPAGPWLVHKKLHIPIYDATLYLVVTKDIEKAYKRLKYFKHDQDGLPSCSALCSSDGEGHFALFFEPDQLRVMAVAHEVFHLAHLVFGWVNSPFDLDSHEPQAILNGYLMDLVCGELGLKVKDKK